MVLLIGITVSALATLLLLALMMVGADCASARDSCAPHVHEGPKAVGRT